jgi:hypothetical protein
MSEQDQVKAIPRSTDLASHPKAERDPLSEASTTSDVSDDDLGSLSLVELLAELGGAELLFRRDDDVCLTAAVIAFPDGRQVLMVERTYRDGIHVLLDPRPEEITAAREGDLWSLWNSKRSRFLHSIV